jgi:PII-like signaling protein
MTSGTSPEEPINESGLGGQVTRLTIYIGESDTWHHKPLYTELVHRAHAAGLAGASVFRGIEGFGSSNKVHTSRLLSLSEDLPVAVVIIDTADRITSFLPEVEEIVGEGLVTLDEATVMVHRYRQPRP